MNVRTHTEMVGLIWRICNLLRGPYKRNEYRKVILPLTVIRRFDCVLAPTREEVLKTFAESAHQTGTVRDRLLREASGRQFYNTSKLTFERLLSDPNHLAQNFNGYIRGFSKNVSDIIDRFGFAEHITRMDERNLLFEVIKAFAAIDLSPERVDNMQMGYVFEELIRLGAEQSNEEAGEHFTPREVIRLMVSLLLSSESDLGKAHVVKTIYDPACGTGGMLSASEEYLREHNAQSRPILYGQDYNEESWAVCKSDMLIKGENADNIILGDSFTDDGYQWRRDGRRWTFDYMLANPPFGVEWKQQQRVIRQEHNTRGYDGRFGAGLPKINDGAMLFLQHMLSKMQPVDDEGQGGSRIAIVFNGSPLFTGDAGSGPSNIRGWIIEKDWLEAIVALPDQMFYNTGISTYIWVLTNRKEPRRAGKIQLIDGRQFFTKMRKSLGKKRHKLSEDQIDDLALIHGNFEDGETRPITDEDPITHQARTRPQVVSKVFNNEDFGYQKIRVERPLRLNFAATPERIARIEDQTTFRNLAKSKKSPGPARDADIAAGQAKQETIRNLLKCLAETTEGAVMRDREEFLRKLSAEVKTAGIRLLVPQRKAMLAALGELDPEAEVCRDHRGNSEPDPKLRDTETVPLGEDIDEYMDREVLPHHPEAWIDHAKTKIGYEIPLNRRFYTGEPPRSLHEIKTDLQTLEAEIGQLLASTAARGLPPDAARSRLNPSPCSNASVLEWLDEVPEHWEVKRLSHIAHYRSSNVDKKTVDGELPVRLCNYTDVYYKERISASDGDFMKATASEREVEGFRLAVGDVVITRDSEDWRDIGVPALIEDSAMDFVCGYHLGIIRAGLSAYPAYLFRLMQSVAVNQQLQVAASGVTRYGLPKAAVSEALVTLPPLEEQRAISEFLDRETRTVNALVAKSRMLIERLDEYRAALIDSAVTGKIDVRDPGEVGVGGDGG